MAQTGVEENLARSRARRALRPSLVARVTRIAVPSLVVAAGAFGVVLAAQPDQSVQAYPAPVVAAAAASTSPTTSPTASPRPSATPSAERSERATRRQTRPKITAPSAKPKVKVVPAPALKVTGTRWSTDELNIRVDPTKSSKVVEVVKSGTKLQVTDAVRDGFRFISYAGKGRWVTAAYLSSKKPDPITAGGISKAPCAKSSKIQSGLTPDAIRVYRAICARYPQVTSFGGRRASNDFHGSGRAVDNMISNSTVGWEIARWERAHAKELGVSEVIYSQKIWTVQRGSEGWRSMSNRGSRTANHYDHVHVSVYGNRGTV
jgi:hypothetical protein